MDYNMIKKLKDRAKHFLESEVRIEEAHRIATLLSPQFRQIRMLPKRERKAVHDSVRERLASMRGDADIREDS